MNQRVKMASFLADISVPSWRVHLQNLESQSIQILQGHSGK